MRSENRNRIRILLASGMTIDDREAASWVLGPGLGSWVGVGGRRRKSSFSILNYDFRTNQTVIKFLYSNEKLLGPMSWNCHDIEASILFWLNQQSTINSGLWTPPLDNSLDSGRIDFLVVTYCNTLKKED